MFSARTGERLISVAGICSAQLPAGGVCLAKIELSTTTIDPVLH